MQRVPIPLTFMGWAEGTYDHLPFSHVQNSNGVLFIRNLATAVYGKEWKNKRTLGKQQQMGRNNGSRELTQAMNSTQPFGTQDGRHLYRCHS